MAYIKSVIRLCPNISDTHIWYERVLKASTESLSLTPEDHSKLEELFNTTISSLCKITVGESSFLLAEAPELNFSNLRVPANHAHFLHLALVCNNIEETYKDLYQQSVEMISSAVITIPQSNESAAGIKAVYFRDCVGHPLELIQFPTDKGNSKWQNRSVPTTQLLGIDHTAISVSDSEISTAHYERLGFKKLGNGHNVGDYQSDLSGVNSADVHLVSMVGVQGYGIEFLGFQNNNISDSRQQYSAIIIHTEDDVSDMTDPDGHLLIALPSAQ